MLLYIFLAPPVYLIEFIFLLQKQPAKIISYGIISFSLQFVALALPIILGYDFYYSFLGLVGVSILRWILLLFLLYKYSVFSISFAYIKEHLKVGLPLILSSLLSGSAQYIDGLIITYRFDEAMFAIFRYGAREFPFVVILANAFSNSMTPEFKNATSLNDVILRIKKSSIKLMHVVFPATIVLLLVSNWIYPIIFNNDFLLSAKIFNIYLVLVISRMVFPQTILIGLKKTKYIMMSSIIEIIINVSLSLLFVVKWGILGVAFATVIAYMFDKVFLIIINKRILKIAPSQFIPFKYHLSYSIVTILVYVLVEFLFFAS